MEIEIKPKELVVVVDALTDALEQYESDLENARDAGQTGEVKFIKDRISTCKKLIFNWKLGE